MVEIWPETFIPNHTWQKAAAQPAAFSSTGVSCPGHCAFPHPQLEAADSHWEASWLRRATRQLWNSLATSWFLCFAWRSMKVMGKLNVQLGVPSQHQETGLQVGQLARAGQGGNETTVHSPLQIKTPSPSNLHRCLGQESKRNKENNDWQCLGLGCDAIDLTFSSLQRSHLPFYISPILKFLFII